ncbi:MAG: PhnD/SsuA/transferrin family substrate-binding protein [Candidatus Dormibacteraeota bacterium]|nr:PhnD/SsuA/transferrin family substrate-binding protein [Candidatus Dormibacteraeota bacterium]
MAKSGGIRAATFLAPCNRRLYEFIASACGAGELAVGGDWQTLGEGAIDLAFVCSPPLVWLKGAVEAIAAPVLDDARFGGRPFYSSEVVVRNDSPYHTFEDLRGTRWAVNESSSWSGYWVVLNRVGAWSFFGEVVESGSHSSSLRLVAGGVVDGAAIDCQVLAVELRDDPVLARRLRVIETLGPAPIQPVVVQASLDAAVKADLQERLLNLRGDVLSAHFIGGFAPPPDYSLIAEVVGRSGSRP